MSWHILTPSLISGTGLLGGQLISNTAHPGSVCMTMSIYDNAPNVTTPPTVAPLPSTLPADGSASQSGSVAISMPPPTQMDVSLLASDDGGATWQGGAVLALRRLYGGVVSPGVAMSADGSCYLTTAQQSGGVFPPSLRQVAFWRLAPGATQPTSIFTITDRGVRSLALAPAGASGGGQERLIALTRISGPGDGERISCGDGCYTYRDGGIYRLIWQPLSSA